MNISTSPDRGGITRVSVAGELDLVTADEFLTQLSSIVAGMQAAALVVDFAEVTFCDSSGIAALDQLYADATTRGVCLQLTNLQPGVRRVLQIVGLLQALTRGQPSGFSSGPRLTDQAGIDAPQGQEQ